MEEDKKLSIYGFVPSERKIIMYCHRCRMRYAADRVEGCPACGKGCVTNLSQGSITKGAESFLREKQKKLLAYNI